MRLDLALLGLAQEHLVHAIADLLERAGEVAVVVDVADELVRQQRLARRQIEQRDLLREVIGEMARVDRDRLVPLALLVLLALAARLEAVEQHRLPSRRRRRRSSPVPASASLPARRDSPAPTSSLSAASSSSSSGSTSSRNGLVSSSCLRCCCRSSRGMYSRSIAWYRRGLTFSSCRSECVLLQTRLHSRQHSLISFGKARAQSRSQRRPQIHLALRYRRRRVHEPYRNTFTCPSNMMYARSTMSSVCSTL